MNERHTGCYTGRFAPSPTGPLHLGSLLAAVASWLDARSRGGRWLLRMEDLDPPRESPGSQQAIIHSLQQHGLHWDGDILYQSQRNLAYRQALDDLEKRHLAYHCDCSRKLTAGKAYQGRCRSRQQQVTEPYATRVVTNSQPITFEDRWQNKQRENLSHSCGDFVLLRKDGLWAYQLAVVVDDHHQGINHVVRGCDLLDSTARQIYLQQLLGYRRPNYAHFPLIIAEDGKKLSKQNLAPAIDDSTPVMNLRRVLQLLGQPKPPEQLQQADHLLAWSSKHWQSKAFNGKTTF